MYLKLKNYKIKIRIKMKIIIQFSIGEEIIITELKSRKKEAGRKKGWEKRKEKRKRWQKPTKICL